jgi:hypothetical protein
MLVVFVGVAGAIAPPPGEQLPHEVDGGTVTPAQAAAVPVATPVTTAPSPDSLEAFQPYVLDGTGDLSIPTAFGRSETAGCACHFDGAATTGDHASLLSAATDTGNGAQSCYSTYPQDIGMYEDEKECEISVTGVNSLAGAVFGDDHKAQITKCLTANRTSTVHPQPTVFLLGDSHSGALLPGLVYAVRGAYQVRRFRTNTVGTIPHHYTGETDVGLKFYVDMYKHVLATLSANMMAGDVVVMSQVMGNWNGAGVPVTATATGPAVDIPAMELIDVIEQDILTDIVTAKGGKLVIFGDWPYFQGTAGVQPAGNAAAAVADVATHAQSQAVIEAMVAKHPTNAAYFSLVPLFCNTGTTLADTDTEMAAGTCSWNIPGTAINGFHNINHLTTVGALYMWPYICDQMTNLGMTAGATASAGASVKARARAAPHVLQPRR